MASLIPALGACASRMTSGERRLAERLEQKLDDDYLLWYDVPIGPKQTHPDFVLLHPWRGLLILETKDWKLETILRANRQASEILANGQLKVVINLLIKAVQSARNLRRRRSLNEYCQRARSKPPQSISRWKSTTPMHFPVTESSFHLRTRKEN